MKNKIIYRELGETLQRFAKLYPIVGITGPRQSGKTTLAKSLFSHLPYVSLENLDTRFMAQKDPRGFLATYKNGAIFDEVQQLPELLSYLQQVVDDSDQVGRYVLTGSQNFALGESITQSLSGRIGMTTLLPFSRHELPEKNNIMTTIFQGCYPRLYKMGMHPLDFYPGYIATYLERDVRQLKNIESLSTFQTFLKLCAGRIGHVLNVSSLARDCGISHTTARQWLTVLQASYIIFLVQPFYKNFSKRLIKMPKLYFYDTGLACNLLGLEKQEQLDSHYLRGELFENMVLLELIKGRLNKALPENLYFWRDKGGHEIDVITEWGGTIKAIEVKAGMTFHTDFVKNLSYFAQLAADAKCYLVYQGDQQGMHQGVTLLSLDMLDELLM